MRIGRTVVSAVALAVVATSTALAQAPRGVAETNVGAVKVSVEYGAPPWSPQRRAQLDQLPVGGVWRLGADRRTTLVVDGGDVFLGDTLVEAGGYGLNVLRRGTKEWAFAVFDGSDTTVALEDGEFDASAQFAEKGEPAPERLVVAFEAAKPDANDLVVRFGPMELRAPVAAASAKSTELELGGEQASARWWSRAAVAAPNVSAWTRVGRLASFWVADVDCGMDVELKLDGATATVRCSNHERRIVTDRLARLERSFARGAGETKKRLDDELAGLAANPTPLEIAVPLAPVQPAKKASGRIAAELVRRDGKLIVVVDAGDRAGEAVVDEAKLLPPAVKK